MTRTWSDIVSSLDSTISGLRWGQYVIVDYDLCGLRQQAPYAQAACGPYGWYAEVASDANIAFWHHDAAWLLEAGWLRPHADDNWQLELPTHGDLAQALVEGLQFGRGCLLPDLFTIRVGRFETPPDGGLPRQLDDLAAA